MKTISDVLKEAAGDVLTEDVLEQIETVFNEAVVEKATLHLEAALTEQDEVHAKKLAQLLEAIDTDHTTKLSKIVGAIDQNHSQKMVSVVRKYESVVNEGAGDFKDTLVESISTYLDEYLEENIPTDSVAEAVRNKRAVTVLEDLRKNLAVNFALSKDYIKDAISDGKQQLDDSSEQVTQLTEANKELSETVGNLHSHILLTEKCADLPTEKANYVYRVLSEKSTDFIEENFDYTLRLFDRTEEDTLEGYKQEVKPQAHNVDRPLITEQAEDPTEREVDSPFSSVYMSELNKF